MAALAAAGVCHAQRQTLHADLVHLRSGAVREWDTFAPTAAGAALQVDFETAANDRPVTLGLRRIDVKESWRVLLNGEPLGDLFSDENDLQETWELPAGRLRSGSNRLSIQAISDRVDDVRIGQIWLDRRPKTIALSETRVRLTAADPSGVALPCRFTIVTADGSLAALHVDPAPRVATRSGVVYTASGSVDVGLPAGAYTIHCGRGPEYEIDSRRAELAVGEFRSFRFQLVRVVDTPGLVACDPHVHTFEISRHGDATLAERMVTLAGEGVEVAVATDHNTFVDYQPYLQQLGLDKYVLSIIGNEVTTPFGHFNIFPAVLNAPLPDHQTDSWEILSQDIRSKVPQSRLAILNHPRDLHAGFTPFATQHMLTATGQRLDGRELWANAMELINSAALQSDPMVLFHDWLTQLNRGQQLTAVGSSDSHEVSRKIVGQGRSYVYARDHSGQISEDEIVDGLVSGRALVSLGLITELEVNSQARAGDTLELNGDRLSVRVVVRGPSWMDADRCELYANGALIDSFAVPAGDPEPGVKAVWETELKKPRYDFHLAAVARGKGVEQPYWPIAKPYQPTSPHWDSYVLGASGVVRIDVDGDHRWSSVREYAERLVAAAEGDFGRLVEQLREGDKTLATFAAEEWERSGNSLQDPAVQNALRGAAEQTRAGFQALMRSQRESLDAQHARSQSQ
jgi:hypothetical protein